MDTRLPCILSEPSLTSAMALAFMLAKITTGVSRRGGKEVLVPAWPGEARVAPCDDAGRRQLTQCRAAREEERRRVGTRDGRERRSALEVRGGAELPRRGGVETVGEE